MRLRIFVFFLLIVLTLAGAYVIFTPHKSGIARNGEFVDAVDEMSQCVVRSAAEEGFDLMVDDKSLSGFDYQVMLGAGMEISCSEQFLEDIMGCSVSVFPTGKVTVDRKNVHLEYNEGSNIILVTQDGNTRRVEFSPNAKVTESGGVFLPVSEVLGNLGYSANYIYSRRAVDFKCIDDGKYLPEAYDMRAVGRVTPVRDQGVYGTCWAFASLGALETILMPEENNVYSVDHMSMNNNFSLELSEGGEHGISISYLASWLGPVMDRDDPYGDGETNTNLQAVKHLEEAIIMKERNDETIKSAIYKYGGVETSMFLEMSYGASDSEFYNGDTASYFYDGEEMPNHAVVLVGWDDNYPKERFKKQPSRNGAYICKNSWGEAFGDGGYFYVSYDDSNLCQETIVYSKLVEPNDFDNIYQTDMLGWIGQMGFGQDSAYFANCYKAEGKENLSAVSFYATGPDTSFSVYIVRNFTDKKSLNDREMVGQGQTRYAGYYTVKFDDEIPLNEGEKYAVIVSIKTPGSERPIAIECDAGDRTEGIDLRDGEGYMSLYGEVWHRAENSECNICLKAFTKNRTAGEADEEGEQ